jgi:hypothetical protein
MPGRRRSLDPAIRSVATESGQSSSAKLDLEREQQKLQQLQKQRDDERAQLESSLSASGLKLESLELKPQKGDISADEVTLVWLPYRISAAGAAEPVYSVGDAP